jgi:hypothetical protein
MYINRAAEDIVLKISKQFVRHAQHATPMVTVLDGTCFTGRDTLSY